MVASAEQQLTTGWRTVGHASARRFLQSSLDSGRVSHAYLITGPARVGRMSLAMDLARAVNCEAASNKPCGRCQQCDRITRGLHAGVRVIDKHTPLRGVGRADASTAEQDERSTAIKIDHIRELQHDAALNPFEGTTHVFILDAAESMTAEAANCLLKTLEEPAAGVLLILIALSASALPETVVSRCQRIDLRLVPAEDIQLGLAELAGAETEQARKLARLSRGRPGWAFAALADPMALDRYRQAVQRILDAVTGSLDHRFRYARNLAGNYRRDRDVVGDELGLWLTWWRDLLLIKHGLCNAISDSDWSETLREIADQVETDTVADVVEAVVDTIDALSRNAVPQLALEVLMLALPRVEAKSVPEPPDGTAGIDIADAPTSGPSAI